MNRLIGATLAALAIAWAGSAGAANFIANGDFEAGGGSFQGWQTEQVVRIGRYDSFASYGAHGAGSEGANNAAWFDTSTGSGSFQQVAMLVPGERYTLSFDFAVLGEGYQSLNLFVFGGTISEPVGWMYKQLNQYAVNNLATSFTRYQFDFRPIEGATTIAFYQGGTGLGVHAALFDNISIDLSTSAVPEPATWAMMIVGFGLAGAGLRRRPGLIQFAS